MIISTMSGSYSSDSINSPLSSSQRRRRKRPRHPTTSSSSSRKMMTSTGTMVVCGSLTMMMMTTMMIGSSPTTRTTTTTTTTTTTQSATFSSIFVSAATSVKIDEKKNKKKTSTAIHSDVPHQRCIGHYLTTHYSSAIVDDDTFAMKSTTTSNNKTEGETSPLSSTSASSSFLRHLRDNVVCEPPSWMMTAQQTGKSKTPPPPPPSSSSSPSNKRGGQKDDEQSKKKPSIWNTKKQQQQQQERQQKKNKNKAETSDSSETTNHNMSETDIKSSSSSPPPQVSSYNVLMLLSEFHHRSIQSQLIIAATLLSKGMNVTVIYLNSQEQNTNNKETRQTIENHIPLQIYSLLPPSSTDEASSDEIPLFQDRFSYMDAPYEVLVKEEEEHQQHRRRALKKQPTASKGTAVDVDGDNNDENIVDDDGRESPPSNTDNIDTKENKVQVDGKYGDGDESLSECHQNETTIDQPFNNCDIKLAPAVLRFLKRHFTQQQQQQLPDKFDVVIHDVAFLGGLMFSELQEIPSIAVVPSYQTLHLALEHDPQWTSTDGSFLYRMYQVWKQRLYSLSLTNVFMKVNKMRKLQNGVANPATITAATANNHHLLPFKSPMDVFLPVAAFLVEFAPKHMIMDQFNAMLVSSGDGNPDGFTFVGLDDGYDDDDDIIGNSNHASTVLATKTFSRQCGIDRIHFAQPLIPPCSPCNHIHSNVEDNDETSSSSKGLPPPIIMVSPSAISSFLSLQGMHVSVDGQELLNKEKISISPEWTRSIVKELVAVRRSLELYDDCSWDPLSCAKNGLDKVRIVWLKPDHPTNDEKNDDNGDDNGSGTAIYPDFFDFVPSVSLLDSLIQHPSTVAVLTYCDTEAKAVTWLGVDVLCISHNDRIPQPYNDDDDIEDEQLGRYGPQHHRKRRRQVKGVWKHISDPADVGTQLLKIMKKREKETREFEATRKADMPEHSPSHAASHPSMGGMDQIVSIVRAVAGSCQGTSQCTTVKDMNRITARAVKDILHPTMNIQGFTDGDGTMLGSHGDDDDGRGDEIQPYDTFTVLVSWLVFLAALGYVLIRDFSIRRRSTSSRSTLSSPYNHHPYHNNHRDRHRHQYNSNNNKNAYGSGSGGSSNENLLLSSGILTRLPDLDDAWDALMRWYHEQPLLLVGNVSADSFVTSGDGSHVVGGTNTGVGRTNQDGGNDGGVMGGGFVDGAAPATDGIGNDLDHGNRDPSDHKNNHQGGHHQGQHIRRRRKARPHHHHR